MRQQEPVRPCVRTWIALAAAILAAPSPVLAEGLAEVFSLGGQSCPASDVDLNTRPTPDLPSTVTASDPPEDPRLTDWPALATTGPIVPLGKDSSGRYFNYKNKVMPLIGVSPDMSCALHVGNGSDICTANLLAVSSYKNVLNDLLSKGLNKMRLLVSYTGAEPAGRRNDGICAKPIQPTDYPFKYVANGNYWRLDQENPQFFRALRDVVKAANNRDILVEVTFFAPWFGVWKAGPYYQGNGRVDLNGDGDVDDAGEQIGLTNRNEFVDRVCPAEGGPVDQICEAQKRVIRWTVRYLWQFPNIYWEIANEPENPQPSSDPAPDCNPTTTPAPVTAQDVEAWQTRMIEVLVQAEAPYVTPNPAQPLPGKLYRPHLIAVQPFSIPGFTSFLGNGNVGIINGHYTSVSKVSANLGAIDLVRAYNKRDPAPPPRILGFNESKISGILCNFNDPSQNCSAVTHDGAQNDGYGGDPDAARAEAWQFLLSRGGTYDHFGYNLTSEHGQSVRTQLGHLLRIMTSSLTPLGQLAPAAPQDDRAPTWINFKTYELSKPEFTYWAALEPRVGATGVQTYFAYIHHSRARNLGFDGFDPEIRTGGSGSPYYSTSFKICFAWPTNTAFKVDWICPKTGACKTDSKTWTGTSGCANDGVGGAMPGAMVITPPQGFNCPYEYDLAVRIRRTGQGSCG